MGINITHNISSGFVALRYDALPEPKVTRAPMSYSTVIYEVAGHVGTITFNRPERLNAFTIPMIAEMDDIWERIKADDEVRVVVLRAAGRAFSVGRDVEEFTIPLDQVNPLGKLPHQAMSPKQHEVWKPVVVAVNGLCGGSGLYWVNEGDIVIASDDAAFFEAHLSINGAALFEGVGLARKIPLSEALRISLLSMDERMTAERAREIGLISEIVPRDKLWERADHLARLIAKKSPLAVHATVKGIWDSVDKERRALFRELEDMRNGPVEGNPMIPGPGMTPPPRDKPMLR
jgi:enoyl-CoA hydratase/carnithine racemase